MRPYSAPAAPPAAVRKLRRRIPLGSSVNNVIAHHAAHHMIDDVTVVKPGARRIFQVVERNAGSWAEHLRIDGNGVGLPAMSVDVKGVKLFPKRHYAPTDSLPDSCPKGG